MGEKQNAERWTVGTMKPFPLLLTWLVACGSAPADYTPALRSTFTKLNRPFDGVVCRGPSACETVAICTVSRGEHLEEWACNPISCVTWYPENWR